MADASNRLAEHATAASALEQMLSAAQGAALLASAVESGILAALRDGPTLDELARATELDPALLEDVCRALRALGAVEARADRLHLTRTFACLTDPDAPHSLEDALAAHEAFVAMLRRACRKTSERSPLESADVIAIARGIWGRPASSVAQASFASLDDANPEVALRWRAGARHVELGCGAGRDLLRIALTYPRTAVVGVDLDAGVLREVTRQAAELGISDRVSVLARDARTLGEVATEAASFDTILWSQIYFADAIRPAVLRAIARSLKADGYLLMPILKAFPEENELASGPGRALALRRTLFRTWDLEWRSAPEVQREVEAAGFRFVRLVPHPRTPFLVMRAPG